MDEDGRPCPLAASRSGDGSRSLGGGWWRRRRPVASSMLPLTFWLVFWLYKMLARLSAAREGLRELLLPLGGTGEGPLLLLVLLLLRLLVLPPPPVLLSLIDMKGLLPFTPPPLAGGRGGG